MRTSLTKPLHSRRHETSGLLHPAVGTNHRDALCSAMGPQVLPVKDIRRGRILFDDWASCWWRLWSSNPRRSPKGMETTDSHLRCHLRPSFGRASSARSPSMWCTGSTSWSSG